MAPPAARDSAYMRRAIALARRGWGQTAPNPLVGAVLVRDGQVVGEGWHARYGGEHAEAAALRVAGERARGATAYVSLEPCAHHGKTPSCADALVAAGVSRVIFATADPHDAAQGGAERLRRAGVLVEQGVEERRARELNAPFLHAQRSDYPWVTLKLALSLDGAVADAAGQSRWITGSRSRREVHRLRAGHDAVAVGIGTALADDPMLTVRGVRAPRVPPLRVVFDRAARLPSESALARTAREIPTAIVTALGESGAAVHLTALGVLVIEAPDLPGALTALRERGVHSLLVEGGARLAAALLDQALVHRLVIFRGPVLLGSGAIPAFAALPSASLESAGRYILLEQRRMGEDTMTTYAPPGKACSPGS